MEQRQRSMGTAASVVLGVVAACFVSCAVAVVAMRITHDGREPEGGNWWLVAWLIAGTAYGTTATVLLLRPGRHLIGLCFAVAGVAFSVTAVATEYAVVVERNSIADRTEPLQPGCSPRSCRSPCCRVTAWRRHRNGWWAMWWLSAGAVAVTVAGVMAAAGWVVATSGAASTAGLGVVWWSRRSTDGDPLPGWLFAGAVTAWLAVVPGIVDVDGWLSRHDVVRPLLLVATVPLLVGGVAITALRDTRTRIHGVSRRVVEWTILAGGIVVLYTVVVAGLGRMLGGSGPTWLLVAATGAIALALEPARHHLRRLVDRLVYGARDDPLPAVQRIVDQLGADPGDGLLPALAASLQHELRLDSVAIDLRVAGGWQRAATTGPLTTYHRQLDLRHRGEVVGRLVIGWVDGPALRQRDREILDQLIGPLSLAVGWVRLAADLRRSSLAIVSAREEERRRLRRDLHDGLGPALTGVSLGLRTAIGQLARTPGIDPSSPSSALLERVADEVDNVVVELKRIVRDLRPTALDQLGLVGAVAEFTRTFGEDMEIHLTLPSEPVELPAAVEVATYRIVTEAVTNVVRHARAARCWLSISTGSVVEIDVADDGIGFDAASADGVGLAAMRERASELGGSVHVEANVPCGTRVQVRLPAELP